MSPVIRECLPLPQKHYRQAGKAATIEDLSELFPGMVALPDASEQPILQPQQPKAEKSHYSGKTKTHTIKVQYTTSFDGLIIHKTAHSPGRDHNFKVYKMKHPTFPTGLPSRDGDVTDKPGRDYLRHYGDTAYRGMDKVVEGIDARISVTRKPGKDLTPDQREYNKAHSRIRIRVENAIRRIKIFRIAKEKYRNKRNKYDLIMDVVCGVVNQTILLKSAGFL